MFRVSFFPRQKVETRLRQLEGKAGGRVTIGNKSASKYDAERKPDAPALLTAAKVSVTS